MINFLKGIVIGIGKVLPGVSGSLIAIRFNLYEDIINSIINFFKDVKTHTYFLTPIFLGVVISILLCSNIILYLLNKYYLIMIILFIALIGTGIPSLYKKGHNFYLIIISFFIFFVLLNIPFKINISYFTMGFIEAFSMIVPGISGTAIYMSLGVYEKVLGLYTSFNIFNWCLFLIGFIISSILIIKIIDYLLKRHKKETYSVILGFLISSIISMITC